MIASSAMSFLKDLRHRAAPFACAAAIVATACNGGAETGAAAQAESAGAVQAEAAPESVTVAAGAAQPTAQPTSADVGDPGRAPNEMGRIMVLEYHLIGDKDARWERSAQRFRQDLQLLYDRGYRPISAAELADGKIDLPAGLSPVVFTFDDASPGQFRYLEQNGQLVIDPTSGVGIWMDFAKSHPGWENKAVFCMLSGAEAGRSFFGNKGIEGQKTEWRHQKVRFLAENGFELCNHTLWHAQLSKYSDAVVQEQIARLQLAVDSAVPGYRIRTFALPLGVWPKNRELAWRGSWTDPKTGKTVSYNHDIVLEVAGGPNVSPYDPKFNGHSVSRVQVYVNELETTLDYLDKSGTRFVSDGRSAPRK